MTADATRRRRGRAGTPTAFGLVPLRLRALGVEFGQVKDVANAAKLIEAFAQRLSKAGVQAAALTGGAAGRLY